MNKDIQEVLISEEQIKEAVERIATQIEKDYEGKEVLFVGLLKGSIAFMADLLKAYKNTTCTIDFMAVSSYGAGTQSSGRVNIIKDLSQPIDGKDIPPRVRELPTNKLLRFFCFYKENRRRSRNS